VQKHPGKIKFSVVNFRQGFFEKDIQAVIFNRPDIQKIMGVFFQLIIGEINLRHDVPFTGKAKTKNIATKALRRKGYIYYFFFVP